MAYFKYICLTILILFIAYVISILYLFKEIDCTAKFVSMMRVCFNKLNPNNITDDFQFGVDNISHNFIKDVKDLNGVCNYCFSKDADGSSYFMQRTYYFDKQIIQTFQKDDEFKQFVILGAGIYIL